MENLHSLIALFDSEDAANVKLAETLLAAHIPQLADTEVKRLYQDLFFAYLDHLFDGASDFRLSCTFWISGQQSNNCKPYTTQQISFSNCYYTDSFKTPFKILNTFDVTPDLKTMRLIFITFERIEGLFYPTLEYRKQGDIKKILCDAHSKINFQSPASENKTDKQIHKIISDACFESVYTLLKDEFVNLVEMCDFELQSEFMTFLDNKSIEKYLQEKFS